MRKYFIVGIVVFLMGLSSVALGQDYGSGTLGTAEGFEGVEFPTWWCGHVHTIRTLVVTETECTVRAYLREGGTWTAPCLPDNMFFVGAATSGHRVCVRMVDPFTFDHVKLLYKP